MGILYSEIIKYDVEMHKRDGGLLFIVSCDGGKFKTDEILGEYVISPKRLMELLEKEEELEQKLTMGAE